MINHPLIIHTKMHLHDVYCSEQEAHRKKEVKRNITHTVKSINILSSSLSVIAMIVLLAPAHDNVCIVIYVWGVHTSQRVFKNDDFPRYINHYGV